MPPPIDPDRIRRRPVDGLALDVWRSEGSSPSGANIAPQPCIRWTAMDPNHEAAIRFGGSEAASPFC